jgi:hypothetical protein
MHFFLLLCFFDFVKKTKKQAPPGQSPGKKKAKLQNIAGIRSCVKDFIIRQLFEIKQIGSKMKT